MKRYIFFMMVIILISTSMSACDSAKQFPPNPDQAEIDNELWLTPLIPTDTRVPASIGTSPGFEIRAPLLEEILGWGPEFESPPGDWAIATPLIPSFYIKSARIHECNGQTYVMINVVNNGPYYFQFITLGINHGTASYGQYGWEDPWVFSEAQCPVATTGWPSYAPGWDGGWIYQPVTVDPAYNEYHIHLSMCTFTSIPDACPYRYYLLTEDYSTKTPTAWVMQMPDIKLKEMVLCWVGPGPLYEVVNSIPEGEEVELLGKGEVEEYIVVKEPKYQRECWMLRAKAEDIPPEIYMSLETFITPLLPTDTPTPVVGAYGEVKGRVFKDTNSNGVFDGKDSGIQGLRVILAHGSCKSPGTAATTTTNNNGRYSFGNVTPGTYCVSVPKTPCTGWSTASQYEVTVTGGGVVNKNFGLTGCP